MERRGVKPRDHARDNVRALREVQRANRAAQEAAMATARGDDGFKLKKFRNVAPRVGATKTARGAGGSSGADSVRGGAVSCARVAACRETAANTGRGAAQGGTATKKFLRKGTRPDPTAEPPKPFRRKAENQKPAVPRADEVAPLAPRSDRDFISTNAREVIEAKPVLPQDEKPAKPATYGKVPKYLEERKELLAEAKAREEARAADGCPPGMHLMPEEERLETLHVLQASKDEVKQQIFRLPLVIETAGQVRRKNALEAKLKEIEDAIAIFDRPHVFVQDE